MCCVLEVLRRVQSVTHEPRPVRRLSDPYRRRVLFGDEDRGMNAADRYRLVAQRLDDIVAAVPHRRWESPSPCEDWSAADVLAHLVTTELDLLERMSFGPSTAIDPSDPRAAWPLVRAHMQSVLEDPTRANFVYDGYFGPTTFAETINAFYCADLTVHGWDIATAAGLTEWLPIDGAEIDCVLASFGPQSTLAETIRQPGLFAAPTEVAPDADATTRLMAWLGRRTS